MRKCEAQRCTECTSAGEHKCRSAQVHKSVAQRCPGAQVRSTEAHRCTSAEMLHKCRKDEPQRYKGVLNAAKMCNESSGTIR